MEPIIYNHYKLKKKIMKNIENNKLIAEFMGAEPLYLIESVEYEMYEVFDFIEYGVLTMDDKLKFHTSWDWLMPVVEEIDHQQYEAIDSIEYAIATRSLKNTYQAVVEYIKQHNAS